MTIKKPCKLNPRNWFSKSPKKVGVICMQGVIGSGGGGAKRSICLKGLKKDIDKIFQTKDVCAIALSINSPGGSPVQSELIYNYIKEAANRYLMPVSAFIEDLGASGGYFIACSASEIYASKSSIVGSIGVISSGFGFVDIIKKLGIERRVITQGKNKSVLDPFKPVKKEDIKIIESIQQDVYNCFKEIVTSSRGNKLSKKEELFTGKFWSGKQALTLGLIDGIGDMYSIMRARYGNDVEFVSIEKPESWLRKRLGIQTSFTDDVVDSLFSRANHEMKMKNPLL